MSGMSNIKEMDAQELHKLLQQENNFRFIDVRTPAEVARGKIEGCENIPLHLIPLKITEFDADEKIVIYCQTGARSGQACAYLSSKGISNAINVRGGIVSWAQMGFPISA